jgi:hypothetical protein
MPAADKLGRRIASLVTDAVPPKYIRAYHGSPHHFSRFDASKIGTGEGAQAYGHGLYFAGAEDVAKTYRDMQPAVPSSPAAKALQELGQRTVALELEAAGIRDAMELAAEERGSLSPGWGTMRDVPPDIRQAMGPRLAAISEELAALRLEQMRTRDGLRGHMYEVQIDYPEEALLDWDAPISRQPKLIQKVFGDFAMDQPGDGGRIYRDIATRHGEAFDDDMTGVLANLEASKELLAEGVPGLRYLDGSSRSAGQGTRNYVMFPGTEDKIRILRQYGLLAPIAAGAAMEDE